MTCIILEKGLLSQDIKNKNGYLRKTLYCINDIVTNIKLKKKKTFYWIKIFPTAIKYVHLTMYVYINVNIQCLYMISCFVCVCVCGGGMSGIATIRLSPWSTTFHWTP